MASRKPTRTSRLDLDWLYFEIQQSFTQIFETISLGMFGRNHSNSPVQHARRIKVLITHSTLFDGLPETEFAMSASPPSLEKYKEQTAARCDSIIELLESLERNPSERMTQSGKALQKVLWNVAELDFFVNRLYAFQKSGKLPAGSYKPAFELFRKEGI